MRVEDVDAAIGVCAIWQGIGSIQEGARGVTGKSQTSINGRGRVIHRDDGTLDVDSRIPTGDRAIQRIKQEAQRW